MPRDGKPPYFPFYPDAFSSDGLVEAMTTEEVGAYILLLCKAWREDPPGSIPNDDRLLARWSRLSDQSWKEAKAAVLQCFETRKDGRLYQKRLRLEYEKFQTRHRKLSLQGRIGAEKRWPGHSQAIATLSPGHKPGYSIASSSSLSSSNSEEKKKHAVPGGNGDLPAAKSRAPDLHFDALKNWMACDPSTGSERGAWNAALKQLKQAGASPEDILRRGVWYEQTYPGIQKTPTGLVKHWGELANGPRKPTAQPERHHETADELRARIDAYKRTKNESR